MNDVEKDLRSGRFVRDLTYYGKPITDKIVVGFERVAGQTGVICLFGEALHKKRGVQMRVAKEVSDDMLLSDLGELRFDEICWPAASVEMFFEDPQLPTMLLGKTDGHELESLIGPGVEIHGDKEPRIMVRLEKKDGVCLVFNLKEPLWHKMFILGEPVPIAGSMQLEMSEEAAMNMMMKLAFKVFAYAAMVKYKPETVSVVTKAMGGKSGFKNRPHRPAVRVVYLPSLHTLRESEPHDPTGKTVTPHERRGYFRMYRHQRYINMIGKTQFIAPVKIKGGGVGNKILVVQK